MKKNTYSELTNDELVKKMIFAKQVLTAFVLIYFVVILILLFMFFNKNFGDVSIALFVPIFIIPVTLAPLYISYNMLKAEQKSRNL
ncbi:hypothetical protein FLAN108750_12555 [Flavobacterium antarcticum]|uniref:hypothetical protein n=1 Tax=Flavobacterium antarcticum TaxID=271155 RepID=UPI0003B34DE1|nr:hypothetical protein [Flavobacterium antarcticum]